MHIPWDEAGCLCLVGDLFNYDAPGMEPHPSPINREACEELEHPTKARVIVRKRVLISITLSEVERNWTENS